LGAFPPIPIASRNVKLKRAVDFVRASRLFFHGAIYKCYDDFNRTDGAVVTLQNGTQINMAKAIILAIFCDHPAARKCCLCGSACPQCFTSEVDFAKAPIGGTMQMRTPGNIAVKKEVSYLLHGLKCVLMYVWFYVLMFVLINVLKYVLINVLKYVLINVIKYVLINVLKYVLINVSMYVLINVMMYVSINVMMYVLINVMMYVLINVLMSVLINVMNNALIISRFYAK
jgi:hypothetical protein